MQQNRLGRAKLTAEMVQWGREQYALGLMNMRQIAQAQGVGREAVARYIRGETWVNAAEMPPGFVTPSMAEHQQGALVQAHMPQEVADAAVQASLARLMKMDLTPQSGQENANEHDANLEELGATGPGGAQGAASAGREAHGEEARVGGDDPGAGDR